MINLFSSRRTGVAPVANYEEVTLNIPILRIPFTDEDRQFIQNGISDILDSGFLTMGKYTRQFEEGFAELTGAKYCIAVSNATAGL